MLSSLAMIENKTILTATGGFLGGGFTHTINLALGCPYGGSLCGSYCYAKSNYWVTKGRAWGLYGFKKNVVNLYREEYDALKRPRRGEPKPVRIYMCSSTDPYPPQKLGRQFTRALLAEMQNRPPDVLVIQTRSPQVASDLDLIATLSTRCELWVSVTVETDMERLPGFPNHATPIRKRIAALKTFRQHGVPTQATISPLLPLADPERFATELGAVCNRVVLDHYLLGDGSPGGLRTKRTRFPEMLEKAGFGEWNHLEKFWQVKATFENVLGAGRVLISKDGFNGVGNGRGGGAVTASGSGSHDERQDQEPRRGRCG
jgi:DNA repair photolyase